MYCNQDREYRNTYLALVFERSQTTNTCLPRLRPCYHGRHGQTSAGCERMTATTGRSGRGCFRWRQSHDSICLLSPASPSHTVVPLHNRVAHHIFLFLLPILVARLPPTHCLLHQTRARRLLFPSPNPACGQALQRNTLRPCPKLRA